VGRGGKVDPLVAREVAGCYRVFWTEERDEAATQMFLEEN